jgi:hypothetical protein
MSARIGAAARILHDGLRAASARAQRRRAHRTVVDVAQSIVAAEARRAYVEAHRARRAA